jgi:hypothetical protein
LAVKLISQEISMRKLMIPFAVAVTIGASAPALAYDSADMMSMQQALAVATDLGVATVSDAEFFGTEWQIEGRDITGRYIEVDVDARTGAVMNVDR